jgi:hypothetical protein
VVRNLTAHPGQGQPAGPFRLVSEPAVVMNEHSVARRLRVSPRQLRFYITRPDFPAPVLKRDGKSYWDPQGVERFAVANGI